MRIQAAIALSSLFLVLAACSDAGDESSSGGTDATTTMDAGSTTMANTSTSAGESDPFTTTGTTSTTAPATETSATDPSTTTGPACDPEDQAVITQCIDMALAQGNCEEVANCNCEACVCQLLACEADEGCVAIRTCAQETGCTGIGCYTPENCQTVIDDAGGVGGSAAAAALQLSDCNGNAGCPLNCESSTGSTSDGSGSGSSDSGGTAATQ